MTSRIPTQNGEVGKKMNFKIPLAPFTSVHKDALKFFIDDGLPEGLHFEKARLAGIPNLAGIPQKSGSYRVTLRANYGNHFELETTLKIVIAEMVEKKQQQQHSEQAEVKPEEGDAAKTTEGAAGQGGQDSDREDL
eukprot:CAMPEP_0115032386 /NCGR_PEP_ID=MMETSP0216-20121206/39128_1 /TAXON_ID=223996 /ORGANISM="Protocruzia adherens, Strain Boccale" /LENGTH=135 /DNA_ID=CAMNT_0002410277 /DNA_START=21 /DNA_END=428 /DNA_ORIENTATION=-